MSEKSNPNMQNVTVRKAKKAWYKKWWIWAIVVFLVLCVAASGGSQKKVTTTTTTTSSKPAEKTTTTTTSTKSTRWDPAAYYDQIQTGQTKAQVEQITTKTSDNCTTSETPGVGAMELCTYGGLTDKGTITVTYLNGSVYSKTKSSY